MSIFVLKGIGGNDITIPLIVFETWEDGFAYLAKYLNITRKYRLLVRQTKDPHRYYKQMFHEKDFDSLAKLVNELKEKGLEFSINDHEFIENQDLSINVDFENRNESEEAISAFFKNGSYYDGCGGVGSLYLEKIEFGEPIVGWNLD